MSILSLQFIGFVIQLVLLYFLLPKKIQWVVLLAASILFYLSGGLDGCLYIVITILSQYLIALCIEKSNGKMRDQMAQEGLDSQQKKAIKRSFGRSKRWLVVLSVFINLGLLFFLKYIDLAIGSFNLKSV